MAKIAKRKGASRRADIPPEILAQLNAGTLETATLAESLAIDYTALLCVALPKHAEAARRCFAAEDGIKRRMELAGAFLANKANDRDLSRLAKHASDTVRGWVPFAIGLLPSLSLADRLNKVQPLADDAHFGVRECAWMGVRPHIATDIETAVVELESWTTSASAYIRRFAVEATRPRGVWCAHITELKESPEQGLPLLEPLRADGEKYVQDSVANWLNDAAKSQPKWVQTLCRRWLRESPTVATRRICQRAQRSIL